MKRVVALGLLAAVGVLFYQARRELVRANRPGVTGLLGQLGLGTGPRVLPATDDPVKASAIPPAHEVGIENIFQVGRGLMVMLKLKAGKIGGNQYLPIFVGTGEALAIAREMHRVRPPRPMTHDLLHDVIASLRGRVERITVTRILDGTFYAAITIIRNGKRVQVDARPSDSMALALRAGAQIYVADEVMRQAGQPDVKPPGPGERRVRSKKSPKPGKVGERERKLKLLRKGFI